MKKGIIIFCFLLIAAVLIWKIYIPDSDSQGEQGSVDQTQIIPVKKGSIRMEVEATGRVVPEQEVEIKCKASGEVIKLPVDISDTVKKGDLLAQLDPEDEKRLVERAEVALAVSQARLAQSKLNLQISERDLGTERTRAEASLKSTEAKIQETTAKLERVKQLLDKKMASREEFDIIQAANAQAVADLESARARIEDLKTREVQIASKRHDIEIAKAQVESDKLSLSDARQRLEDTTMLAPIDGVVAERNVQVGQIIASGINNVGGGTTLMKLADLSRIYVLVSVDESDIGMIDVGQKARITVDSYPNEVFSGRIIRVAIKGLNSSNVVTFEVKVEVEGENRQLLKPEMTANVSILAAEKNNVLLIPVVVIKRKKLEHYVTVKSKDGSTEERLVKTGISDGEFMEITSGLSEGEKIVVADNGLQGPWQNTEGKGGNVRQDMMRMRMMGGRQR
jgi:HlyD family secretion protein